MFANALPATVWRRVAITAGILLIYRLGLAVPVPGLDPRPFHTSEGLAIYPGRMSLFALGISPYLAACMLLHVVTRCRSFLNSAGPHRLPNPLAASRWAHYGTFAIASATAMIAVSAMQLARLLDPNDVLGAATAVLTFVAGALFLAWLAEQIDVHGVGPGAIVILTAQLLSYLPRAVPVILEIGRQEHKIAYDMLGTVGLFVLQILLLAVLARTRRRVELETPTGRVHAKVRIEHDAAVALAFALVLLQLIVLISTFIVSVGGGRQQFFLYEGLPFHVALKGALVFAFVLSCGCGPFRPDAIGAERGAGRPALPEKAAADLQRVRWRAALMSASVVASSCVVSELIVTRGTLPFTFSSSLMSLVALAVIGMMDRLRSEVQL